MSDLKASDEQILYCLQNLAGYEPDDIDCDDVDIAVNDDQFASMSIVRIAELGAELIVMQQKDIELYKSAFEAANAKLGEIACTLCNEGLGVAEWHQNGGMKEMDTFFNDNDWDEVDVDEIKEQLAATAKG